MKIYGLVYISPLRLRQLLNFIGYRETKPFEFRYLNFHLKAIRKHTKWFSIGLHVDVFLKSISHPKAITNGSTISEELELIAKIIDNKKRVKIKQ